MVSERDKGIIRASIVGIAGNLVLTAFKLLVGVMASSIAIILDGVNNATDALSSLITIAGTKLASRRADRAHPFGYGRVEYVTSVAIALIILGAGVISMRESVLKIISPADPDYRMVTLVVIIASIAAKVIIGLYFRRRGAQLRSEALRASGIDSDYDAVLSAGTLVAALAMMLWKVNIDGIVGAIISLFVLKAGFDILRDAVNPIIGCRESDELGRQLKSHIASYPEVKDAYDLILDDFGPNVMVGSVHIEVPDAMTACDIDRLTRAIVKDVAEKFNVILTVGIYAQNTTGAFAPVCDELRRIVAAHPSVLQMHGFYGDEKTDTVCFDLVIDFGADAQSVRDDVVGALKVAYPRFSYNVTIDTDCLD